MMASSLETTFCSLTLSPVLIVEAAYVRMSPCWDLRASSLLETIHWAPTSLSCPPVKRPESVINQDWHQLSLALPTLPVLN